MVGVIAQQRVFALHKANEGQKLVGFPAYQDRVSIFQKGTGELHHQNEMNKTDLRTLIFIVNFCSQCVGTHCVRDFVLTDFTITVIYHFGNLPLT